MTTESRDRYPEKPAHLWALAASPSLWAAHFLLSYATAAVYCAKFAGSDASLAPARIAIAVYTVVALGGIAVVGWRGVQRHRTGAADVPHDDDSPEDRHRFLGLATALLSGLSAVATVYSALAAVFVGSCR
jgi:hypothetical protein